MALTHGGKEVAFENQLELVPERQALSANPTSPINNCKIFQSVLLRSVLKLEKNVLFALILY